MGALGLLAAFAVALPAMAVERGFYIAGDYDTNRFDRTAAQFDAQLEPFLECGLSSDIYCSDAPDVSIDQSSLGKKAHGYDLWVGYQFSPYFAVEGAYLDMGRIHHAFSGTADFGPVDVDGDGTADFDGPQPLSGSTTFHTRGPGVAAVAAADVGEFFSIDARAGLFFADNKLALDFTIAPPTGAQTFSYSESDSKTSLFYGAAATFWITPYVGLRGGFSEYSKGAFDHDVKQYFLGIRYSYGY